MVALALPDAAEAQDARGTVTVEELQRQLAERDAVIADLRERVEQLELWSRERGAQAAEAPSPVPAPAPPPPTRAADADAAPTPGPAAPGQFEIDEEAVDRALERALVQTGALLLRPGTIEVEPEFIYAREEDDAPVFFQQGGQQFLATRELRRDILQAGLTIRAGLPFESQIELSLPYRYEERDSATRVGFTGVAEDSSNAGGLGDVAIELSKGLLRERGLRPDLIASLRWDTDTGEDEEDIVLGSGFNEVSGALTAVKRLDPLAFVANLSYTAALEEDDLDPGDEVGLAVGTVLAAGPETSLRFFLQQSFAAEDEFNGRAIPGSDETIGTFVVGASAVLAPRMLLDVTAGIGLTEDAPDYSIRVSLPIRLDLF